MKRQMLPDGKTVAFFPPFFHVSDPFSLVFPWKRAISLSELVLTHARTHARKHACTHGYRYARMHTRTLGHRFERIHAGRQELKDTRTRIRTLEQTDGCMDRWMHGWKQTTQGWAHTHHAHIKIDNVFQRSYVVTSDNLGAPWID